MADIQYITTDTLQLFFSVPDSASDAKQNKAIAFASAYFDRLAHKPLGYFLTNFGASPPQDVQYAVAQLTVNLLRRFDPIDVQAAGITNPNTINGVPAQVQLIADAYGQNMPVLEQALVPPDPPLWDNVDWVTVEDQTTPNGWII